MHNLPILPFSVSCMQTKHLVSHHNYYLQHFLYNVTQFPPPHEPKGFQTVMEEGSVNKTLCLQIITNVIPGLETNCLLLYMCAILDYGSCCPYQQKNGGRKSVKSSKNKQMTIRLVPPTWWTLLTKSFWHALCSFKFYFFILDTRYYMNTQIISWISCMCFWELDRSVYRTICKNADHSVKANDALSKAPTMYKDVCNCSTYCVTSFSSLYLSVLFSPNSL